MKKLLFGPSASGLALTKITTCSPPDAFRGSGTKALLDPCTTAPAD